MRRHRWDPGALVAGVFFLAIAAVFLADGFSEGGVAGVEILAPTAIVGLGVVGVVQMVSRARRRDPR